MLAVQRGDLIADRYRVERAIGSGGMSYVYAVLDEYLHETVALKLLQPELVSDENLVERFKREVRIARQLTHPNIIRIYELGRAVVQEQTVYYITMELLNGTDLHDWMRQHKKPTFAQILDIGKQLCEALAEAHRLGVVHRDLKPPNIFMDSEGRLKLMDFGISRLSSATGVTRGAQMMGTPAYMSPEQALGVSAVDARSDIYSLGVLLYQLSAGRCPFVSDSAMGVIYQHVEMEPPPPRQFNSEIPRSLEKVLLTCLQKRPHRRFESADALGEALEKIRTELKPETEAAAAPVDETVVLRSSGMEAPATDIPAPRPPTETSRDTEIISRKSSAPEPERHHTTRQKIEPAASPAPAAASPAPAPTPRPKPEATPVAKAKESTPPPVAKKKKASGKPKPAKVETRAATPPPRPAPAKPATPLPAESEPAPRHAQAKAAATPAPQPVPRRAQTPAPRTPLPTPGPPKTPVRSGPAPMARPRTPLPLPSRGAAADDAFPEPAPAGKAVSIVVALSTLVLVGSVAIYFIFGPAGPDDAGAANPIVPPSESTAGPGATDSEPAAGAVAVDEAEGVSDEAPIEAPEEAAVPPPASETSGEEPSPTVPASTMGAVSLSSDPSGATLTIDGRSVGKTPWDGELPPGRHEVRARRTGYEDSRVEVVVRAGLKTSEQLRMKAEAPVAPGRPTEPEARRPPTRRTPEPNVAPSPEPLVEAPAATDIKPEVTPDVKPGGPGPDKDAGVERSNRLGEMQEAFAGAAAVDGDRGASPVAKAQAWKSFLADHRADDPSSQEDERLRNQAQQRLLQLRRQSARWFLDRVKQGDAAQVREALASGLADPNTKDSNDTTALMWAAENGYDPIVVLLIQAGADLDARDKSSFTALRRASRRGRGRIVQILKDAGAK